MQYWVFALLFLLALGRKKKRPIAGFGGLRPVYQNVHGLGPDGKPQGNCFPACIASILGMGLKQVPFFSTSSQNDQIKDANGWLKQFNLKLVMLPFRNQLGSGYCLARGESPRFPGSFHMVVWRNGKVVHDPHPDQQGIVGDPTHLIVFKKC